jgi:hypothetical protein
MKQATASLKRSHSPRKREPRRMAAMTARSTELSSTARTCGVPAQTPAFALATTAPPALDISTSPRAKQQKEARLRHVSECRVEWNEHDQQKPVRRRPPRDQGPCGAVMYTRGEPGLPDTEGNGEAIHSAAVRRVNPRDIRYGRHRSPSIYSSPPGTQPRTGGSLPLPAPRIKGSAAP